MLQFSKEHEEGEKENREEKERKWEEKLHSEREGHKGSKREEQEVQFYQDDTVSQGILFSVF